MIKIGEALSTNSTLTKLDLSVNILTILCMMRKCSYLLQQVLLDIADPYYLEIFKCFEANQTLTSLKIVRIPLLSYSLLILNARVGK